MKIVKENLSFKRNVKPSEALNIGKYAKIMKPADEDWRRLPAGEYLLKRIDSNPYFRPGCFYMKVDWDPNSLSWSTGGWRETKSEALSGPSSDNNHDIYFPGFIYTGKSSGPANIEYIIPIHKETD